MPKSNLIKSIYLEAQTGAGFKVKRGDNIRVIDVQGEQVSDLVCFVDGNIQESYKPPSYPMKTRWTWKSEDSVR